MGTACLLPVLCDEPETCLRKITGRIGGLAAKLLQTILQDCRNGFCLLRVHSFLVLGGLLGLAWLVLGRRVEGSRAVVNFILLLLDLCKDGHQLLSFSGIVFWVTWGNLVLVTVSELGNDILLLIIGAWGRVILVGLGLAVDPTLRGGHNSHQLFKGGSGGSAGRRIFRSIFNILKQV